MKSFELIGPGANRTRIEASRARGFSRFVGREREVAVLDAALGRAADGDGGVAPIAAAPSGAAFKAIRPARVSMQ